MELELLSKLDEIAINTMHIKAFCYALAVALAIVVVLFVFNWIVRIIIGSRF